MKSVFALVFAILLHINCFAKNAFFYDAHFSPYAGAENILTLKEGASQIESYLNRFEGERGFGPFSLRFAITTLCYTPYDYFLMALQHEFFGHGYRIRSLGQEKGWVTGYFFNTPPPYGKGGALTEAILTNRATMIDYTAFMIGGIDATSILANRMENRWFEKGAIDPKEVILYFYARSDLSHYIDQMSHEEGNDLGAFSQCMKLLYGEDFDQQKLKEQRTINILNPFIYYATYAYWHYLVTGESLPFFFIPIGPVKYLPSFSLGLTPFGTEATMRQLIRYKNSSFFASFSFGANPLFSYQRCSISLKEIFSQGPLSIGVRGSIWRQPLFNQILLRKESSLPSSQIGGMLTLLVNKQRGERSALEGEFGYKTEGFIPGESLYRGPIIRLGYSFHF